MKTPSHPRLAASAWLLLAAALGSFLLGVLPAQQADMVPELVITEGLPGTQVRISWQAEPGARYAIEKSPDLSPGSWKRLALVEPSQAAATWLDPETTRERFFYRVTKPQAEVFSIDFPVLTSVGGTLVIHAQSLPPGSSLMIETEGGETQFFALVSQADGTWHADITGTFALDAVLTARVHSRGQTLGTAIHPVVTRSGLMSDGPASLPPAAPISVADNGRPIPGIGGGNGQEADDCDDTNTTVHPGMKSSPLYENNGHEGVNPLYSGSSNGGTSPLYQGLGLQNNPAFQSNGMVGQMPHLHAPLGTGVPGEVGFHACDLALKTPAGPALAWVRTYRSKGSTSLHGTCFSYDIFIEPEPASQGASAPRIRIHDGGGRADVFHRQPDGSFTCDGMFREGRFDGETFTLTFFDQGRWVFRPLDGSLAAGKISSIIDVHGNALTCDYSAGGLLGSVSNSLGQSLSVGHDVRGRVATVTDHTGRFVSYEYYQQGETGGPPGSVKSVSCPIIPGQPPVCGPTTYTYTTGQAHPALDGNLLSIHDGAGRLLEAFTYSSQSDPREVDFDTVATHDAHRTNPASDAVCVLKLVRLPAGVAPRGGYTVFHNDEVGRLTEVVCDPLHRPVSVKQYTGFATPGVACDATTNRPSNKLRTTDPDFFETTASYNIDGMPRRCTLPDGSQLVAVFERDLNPACTTRERGNARTLTIRSASGEERTVSCDYLPGFGTPESARPGNPINGLSIKAGRNPGGDVASSRNRRLPALQYQAWDDSLRHRLHGGPPPDWCGLPIGQCGPPPLAYLSGPEGGIDDDCDGIGMTAMFRKILDYGEAGASPRVARLTTAHGQVFTWTHDAHGRCVAHATPVSGQGFTASYDLQGRCVSRTTLDGDGPGFRTDVHYDAATGFLQSVVIDPDGLALTETQDSDDLGRPIRYTDPRGHQWLIEYNALDLPARIDSPPAQGGQPIITRLYYDGGGNFFCGKTDHLRSDGSPVQENADYATVVVRDSRGRVIRIAEEIFPVDYDPAAGIDLADLGLENFAVIDIIYGPDGRCSRLSVPAASRQSTEDADCDFTYDERGLVHSVIVQASPTITHEYHYTAAGQVSSRVTVAGQGQPSPAVHFAYDGFHRIRSFIDAMGNETEFDYSSRGHVTTSVFGEITDVPGGAGNVLLERARVRFRQSPTVPGSAARREHTAVIGFACTSGASASRSSKKGYDYYSALSATSARASKKGYDYYRASSDSNASGTVCPGEGDEDPPFVALTLPGVTDATYDINGGAASSALELPGVGDVVWDIKVSARSSASPFHGWFVAHDTIEAERFAAGAPAPHPVEVTTLTRSPAGLPIHLSRNGDSLATCDHDTAGRLISVTNAACRVEVVRDASGNIISSTRSDFSTESGMPAKTFTVARVIDALGRTTSLADGSGSSVSFGYDSLQRMTSFTDPVSGVLTAEYDGTTADGLYSVRYHKDMDGDGIPEFLGAVTTPALNGRTCTCPLGYLSRSSTDALGRTTRRDYPDGTFETFGYDARGFLTEILHRDGTLATLTHDLNGRVVSETLTGGSPDQPAAPVRQFTYDGRGFVRSIEEGTSVCAWTQDSLGNVLTETQSGGSIAHTYDHRGRTGFVTSVQWPYRLSIVETRDAFGRVTAVIARDDAGQLVSPPVATFQHLGMRVSRCDTANGVSTVHTYRGDGDPPLPGTSNFGFDRCVATESSQQGKAIWASKKGYDYYQAQSSMSITHRDGSTRNHTHERDPLGRIISSQIVFDAGDGIVQTEHDVAYTRNARGDRLSATGGENPGQYVQFDTLPPGDAQRGRYTSWPRGAVEWDANGNLKQLPTATGGFEYQQDTRGRLVSVSSGASGETLAEFSYDGCDRLVERVLHSNDGLPPTATRFLYDGGVCIHEIDVSSGLPAQSHVVCDGTHLRTTTSGGDTWYLHLSCGRAGTTTATYTGNLSYVAPCDATCITDAEGATVAIISFNDSGLPIHYDGDGLLITGDQGGTDHGWAGGPAWAGRIWVPSVRLHLHGGGASSPDLGMQVCSGGFWMQTTEVTQGQWK